MCARLGNYRPVCPAGTEDDLIFTLIVLDLFLLCFICFFFWFFFLLVTRHLVSGGGV